MDIVNLFKIFNHAVCVDLLHQEDCQWVWVLLFCGIIGDTTTETKWHRMVR